MSNNINTISTGQSPAIRSDEVGNETRESSKDEPKTDSPPEPRNARKWRPIAFMGRFARLVPTILILAVLAGIGIWGHHTGWSMSKFSEVTGQEAAEKDDWCAEHGVPESVCIACNAELMPKPKPYGWCEEHGVHECPFHHPDVAQLDKTAKVEKRDLDRAKRALELRERKQNNPACQLHLRRIQFVSKQAVEDAGIDIGLVDRKKIVESIPATGEITYDQTRVARLSSRSSGTVWRVDKQIGDKIRRGEILAIVDASEVGRLKSELLSAVTAYDLAKLNRDQIKPVAGKGVAGRLLQEAEAKLSTESIRVQRAIQSLVNLGFSLSVKEVMATERSKLLSSLQFLGIPDDVTRYLVAGKSTSNLIPIRAPADGVVVERDVVAGEVVDTRKVLFTVVDTSQMWLILDVSSEHASLLKTGRKVLFRPDDNRTEVTGFISWISTKIDSHTRTVKIRVELPNPHGHLRDETFGQGEIVLREDSGSIVVPSTAVHWEGCCHVVFVRDRDYLKKGSFKVFHPRVVRPGVRTETHTEILAGVMPWEVVVTKGSGVLRAELLKGNLGPG